jgi:hypothetical protein
MISRAPFSHRPARRTFRRQSPSRNSPRHARGLATSGSAARPPNRTSLWKRHRLPSPTWAAFYGMRTEQLPLALHKPTKGTASVDIPAQRYAAARCAGYMRRPPQTLTSRRLSRAPPAAVCSSVRRRIGRELSREEAGQECLETCSPVERRRMDGAMDHQFTKLGWARTFAARLSERKDRQSEHSLRPAFPQRLRKALEAVSHNIELSCPAESSARSEPCNAPHFSSHRRAFLSPIFPGALVA